MSWKRFLILLTIIPLSVVFGLSFTKATHEFNGISMLPDMAKLVPNLGYSTWMVRFVLVLCAAVSYLLIRVFIKDR
jgi:hypothetical protein